MVLFCIRPPNVKKFQFSYETRSLGLPPFCVVWPFLDSFDIHPSANPNTPNALLHFCWRDVFDAGLWGEKEFGVWGFSVWTRPSMLDGDRLSHDAPLQSEDPHNPRKFTSFVMHGFIARTVQVFGKKWRSVCKFVRKVASHLCNKTLNFRKTRKQKKIISNFKKVPLIHASFLQCWKVSKCLFPLSNFWPFPVCSFHCTIVVPALFQPVLFTNAHFKWNLFASRQSVPGVIGKLHMKVKSI